MAGAQRRVAGKRQLAAGCEDAHAVVGPGCFGLVAGGQHKCGFAQVGPLGEVFHLFGAQAGAIQNHGQRVAEVGRGGEDVDLFEGAGFHEGEFG